MTNHLHAPGNSSDRRPPRIHRRTPAHELARRGRDLRRWLGRQVFRLRTETGVTQAALAHAAGIDQAHLSRIERGTARPSLDVLVGVAAALGADLSVRLFPGVGPRLQDRFQAPMIEALLRILDPRWTALAEVPVGQPTRGIVDLVLNDGTVGISIAGEAQSELRRLEQSIRWSTEKSEMLASRRIYGPEVSRLLLLRSTVATRDLARQFEATLSAAFPARTADAVAALRRPDVPWPGPAIVWVRVERGVGEILDRPPRGVPVGR